MSIFAGSVVERVELQKKPRCASSRSHMQPHSSQWLGDRASMIIYKLRAEISSALKRNVRDVWNAACFDVLRWSERHFGFERDAVRTEDTVIQTPKRFEPTLRNLRLVLVLLGRSCSLFSIGAST